MGSGLSARRRVRALMAQWIERAQVRAHTNDTMSNIFRGAPVNFLYGRAPQLDAPLDVAAGVCAGLACLSVGMSVCLYVCLHRRLRASGLNM